MTSPDRHTHDLVVVANRLPVDKVTDADGEIEWRPSPGGLVTAMEPVMKGREGAWVGWTGEAGGHPPEPFEADGMWLQPVALSAPGGRGPLRGLLATTPCGRSTTT